VCEASSSDVCTCHRRCVTGAMAQRRCCGHTYAATLLTQPATSAKSAVARSCIAAIWKFIPPSTPRNVLSPVALVESHSRQLRPSILTKLSTNLRMSPVMCAQNVESHLKRSSGFVLTSSDIRELNRTVVGAVVVLSRIEADLQNM